MPDTHDCGGDAAAYVLGALEPAEAEAFRAHLEECTVCRDELDALEDVALTLPMAAPAHQAPRRLRRHVMRAVRQEPKRRERTRRRSSLGTWPGSRPALGALAAAAVVALAVIGGLELTSAGSRSRVIQAHVSGISGSAELRVGEQRGELIVHHLTAPPAGHIYEVWLKASGSAPRPASVLFTVNSGGDADVGVPGSLRGINQVMVTPEPDGGSLAPTHSAVIVATLS